MSKQFSYTISINTICILCLLFLLSFTVHANNIFYGSIEINFDKVVHIILPSEVELVATGSELIEATVVPEAKNIVRIVAMEENFANETNATIIDKSGMMYTFQVKYISDPVAPLISVYYPNATTTKEDINIHINNQNKAFVIFPQDIVYSYEGNDNSILSTITSAKNIVHISTSATEFPQTNLFAVDIQGNEYNLIINYGTANNYIYNLKAKKGDLAPSATPVARVDNNITYLEKLAETALKTPKKIHYIGTRKNKVDFSIDNIFVNDEYVLFVISIANNSNINYDIDIMKYFFADKKVSKNAVQQELPQEPINLGQKYQIKTIKGKEKIQYPLMFRKFTIPDDKLLRIEIFEKGGGRHINFNATNEDVMKATPF